jgi:hypothetical protein
MIAHKTCYSSQLAPPTPASSSPAAASFVLILEALCDHVYQQAQRSASADPIARDVQPAVAAALGPSDCASAPQSSSNASLPACSVALSSAAPPSQLPPAAAAASSGHGMVVDALGALPSIHARRSVIVDDNGATFSADDVAARRVRKEQRRRRALQEAEAAQAAAAVGSVAEEKPNAPLPAAAASWTDVPVEFCCALNGSLMKQPVRSPFLTRCPLRKTCDKLSKRDPPPQVKSKYGHSFDRACILKWLQQHSNTCPITRQSLLPADLQPDTALEKRAHAWQIQQTLAQQRPFDDLYEF